MFLLKSRQDEVHILSPEQENVVGRKGADILLLEDASISRRHAIIKITSNQATITDLKSKYGTFLRGEKITPGIDQMLNHCDEVKFGVFQNIFTFEKIAAVTTASGLSNLHKSEVKRHVSFIGGKYLDEWSPQCTHLTMQETVVTVKFLHALLDGRPVVTPEFWAKYVENYKNKLPPPAVEDFKPPLARSIVTGELVNGDRRNFFKGKVFVFWNEKKMAPMKEIIVKLGGKCVNFEEDNITLAEVERGMREYLFMNPEKEEVSEKLKVIHEEVRKKGKRLIAVKEIGLAVWNCSCEKDCNPNFRLLEQVFPKEEEVESEAVALVADTLEVDSPGPSRAVGVIPSSFDPFEVSISEDMLIGADEPPVQVKRQLEDSDEEEEENPFKRPRKTVQQKKEDEASKKRRHEADTEIAPPPQKKTTPTDNPFLNLANRKVIPPTSTSSNNPFALNLKKEKPDSCTNDSAAKVAPSTSHAANRSFLTSLESTSSADVQWMSKSVFNRSEMIKIEDEFKEVYDKFKGTCVVEVAPDLFRKKRVDVSVDERSYEGKNFKRFKKCQPLRLQTTIIAVASSAPVVAPSRVDDAQLRRVLGVDDDDDRQDVPIPAPKKRSKNKFAF